MAGADPEVVEVVEVPLLLLMIPFELADDREAEGPLIQIGFPSAPIVNRGIIAFDNSALAADEAPLNRLANDICGKDAGEVEAEVLELVEFEGIKGLPLIEEDPVALLLLPPAVVTDPLIDAVDGLIAM